MRYFLPIFVQRRDGRLAVPEGITPSPKLTTPPNRPKMMFLDVPDPKTSFWGGWGVVSLGRG